MPAPPLSAFTSASPAPGGGYLFERPGAPPLRFAGPEADRLAGLLQRQADTRTAEIPTVTGPVGAPVNLLGGRMDPSWRAEAAPPRVTDALPPAPGPAHVPRGAAPASTPDDASGLPLAVQPTSDEPAAPVLPERRRVYSPGYDPTKDAASRVAVPTVRTMQIEGGAPPEAREMLTGAYTNLAKAEREEFDARSALLQRDTETARAQAATAAQVATAAEEDALRRQKEMARQKAAYDGRIQQAEEVLADQNKREPDTYRIFRGKPANLFTMIAAQFMGSMGQQLTGSHVNYAAEAINRAIDEDIRSQRESIQRGIKGAETELGRLKERFGLDMGEAESLYRVAVNRRQQALLEQQSATGRVGTNNVALAELKKNLQAEGVKRAREFQTAVMGSIKSSESYDMKAARQGGARFQTWEEMAREEDAKARVVEAVRKQRGEPSGEEVAAERKDLAKQTRQLEGAQSALDIAASRGGLQKVNGRWVQPEGGDIPGVGGPSAASLPLVGGHTEAGKQATAFRFAAGRAAADFMRRQGFEPSGPAEQAFVESVVSAKTDAEAVEILNQMQAQIDAERDTVSRGPGARAVREFDREGRRVQREVGRQEAERPRTEGR